jgi:hypothetical protein
MSTYSDRVAAWTDHSVAKQRRDRVALEIAEIVTGAFTDNEPIVWLNPNNDAWLRLESALSEFDTLQEQTEVALQRWKAAGG